MIIYPLSSPILFTICGFNIYRYGIVMAISIFTGIFLCLYLFKKFKSEFEENIFIDISAYIVIISIIGARLFYVIGNWGYYSCNLREIIMINHGGISIYGAIIFGYISAFIFSKIKKFNLLSFLDVIALVLPLCQSIGRWGNYFNQEAYGAPYNGLIKLYVTPEHRLMGFENIEFYHPTFLYESIMDFILFILLLTLFIKYRNIKTGTITVLYLFLYSIIRIFVELIRIDSVCYVFNLPVAVLIAAVVIIFSLILTVCIYFKKD